MRITCIILLAALITGNTGCDLDVPDLNNPGIDDLAENPTAPAVTAACTGLIIGGRRNHAASNGYVIQLGILGREAYNFDQADPRYFGELLVGSLQQGSPFGGNFWALPYANIRLANTVLTAVEKVPDFSPEEKASIKGFTKTMIALDLLEVISTHDDVGAVIDTNKPIDQLGAIADKTSVLTEIGKQLDDGAAELANGGMKFPFLLSEGHKGFDTPATFRKFNRAIRARVAVYQKNYAVANTALGESFINDTAATQADLDKGVYYSYSTAAGDTTNALVNPNIYAHPSIAMEAVTGDQRLARKVGMAAKAGSGSGVTSMLTFKLYPSPSSPVALIRNEELLLLRSEARFFTNDVPGAMADLNLVRTVSGGLTAVPGTPAMDAYVTALLYEREFSLLFEGHRWIDVRRFDKLDSLPLDNPEWKRNKRYPLPLAECNARPSEAACMLNSL